MLSINELALDIVEDMLDYEEELRIQSKKLENGATVVDCGVEVPGSYDAGIMYTQICMGGLASVDIVVDYVNDIPFAFVTEYTDHPAVACLGSQKAGWAVQVDKYFAMGSGPARALALKPKKLFKEIGYQDTADEALIVLETGKYPPEEAVKLIADTANVKPSNVTVIVTPTQSLAGSVQISARIVETGIHKLHTVGFHLDKFVSGAGFAPVAPPHPDPTVAMGRTNDMILYGGVATYYVNAEDSEITEVLKKAPSSASRDYGKPFYEAFKEAGFDFYKIDPNLFAPAKYVVYNVKTGNTFSAGYINVDVLKRSIAYSSV